MTVSQQFLITTLFSGLGFIFGFIAILMGIMWRHLNLRLTSLGHEDRAIRGQMHDLMKILMEQHSDQRGKDMETEISRLKWVLEVVKDGVPASKKTPG